MEEMVRVFEVKESAVGGDSWSKYFASGQEAYLAEWDLDEDLETDIRQMVETRKATMQDWGVVEDGDTVYFIQYFL